MNATTTHEVLCNKCGGTCMLRPARDADPEQHGLIGAEVTGGIASVHLRDSTAYRFSLCEQCLAALFGAFKVPPEVEHLWGDGTKGPTTWAEDRRERDVQAQSEIAARLDRAVLALVRLGILADRAGRKDSARPLGRDIDLGSAAAAHREGALAELRALAEIQRRGDYPICDWLTRVGHCSAERIEACCQWIDDGSIRRDTLADFVADLALAGAQLAEWARAGSAAPAAPAEGRMA